MNFYFDCETIPLQDADLIAEMRADMSADLEAALASVRAPSNYKDEAKIADYIACKRAELSAEHEAKVQDAYLKTSFDGGLGQVCVIAWAVDDGDIQVASVEDLGRECERGLIRGFFGSIGVHTSGRPPCFIGHNVVGFDIRFLWQRAMVLGIKPPFHFPRDPKPWGEQTFDTMTAWSGVRDRISMDKLCRIFGIPGKGGMDGSKVWPLVQEGRIAEVAEYCKGDVHRTRELHRRMTFAGV